MIQNKKRFFANKHKSLLLTSLFISALVLSACAQVNPQTSLKNKPVVNDPIVSQNSEPNVVDQTTPNTNFTPSHPIASGLEPNNNEQSENNQDKSSNINDKPLADSDNDNASKSNVENHPVVNNFNVDDSNKNQSSNILITNPNWDDNNPELTNSTKQIQKYTNVLPSGLYQHRTEPLVYNSSWQLANKYLGFNHQNFDVRKDLDTNNKFLKTYRIQQLLKDKKWKLDFKKQELSWSLNKSEIDAITSSDASASNIHLWIYLDITDKQKSKIKNINSSSLFNTKTFNIRWNKVKPYQFSDTNSWYEVGIEVPLNKIIDNNQKELIITNDKYFDLAISYDRETKKINFVIRKKTVFVQNFYEDIYTATRVNDGIAFSSHSNFINVSFLSDNDQNQTLGNYQMPKQYVERKEDINKLFNKKQAEVFSNYVTAFDPKNPWKTNTNAFDVRLQENLTVNKYQQRQYSNTFIPLTEQVNKYNDFDIADEMRIRSFGTSGTVTMIGKVKPSDSNDHRYYVITNDHVHAWFGNIKGMSVFEKIGNDFFLDSYNALIKSERDGYTRKHGRLEFQIQNLFEIDRTINDKDWVFGELEKIRYSDGSLENNEYSQIDAKFAILNLDVLMKVVKGLSTERIGREWNASERINKQKVKDNYASVLEDLKKWPSLKPLKWSNKYMNIEKSGEHLVDWYVSSYADYATGSTKINKIDVGKTGNYDFALRWQSESLGLEMIDDSSEKIFTPGSSGSLIIDSDHNMVGLMSSLSGRLKGFAPLKGSHFDTLGFGPYSYFENSKIINPNNPVINDTSLNYFIKQAIKKYPNKFEEIPEWNQKLEE